MKILFVTEQYTPTVGGAIVATQQLMKGLVQQGHEVGIVTISPHIWGGPSGKPDETGAMAYRCMSVPAIVNPKANYMTIFPWLTVPYVMLKMRPDCIHMMTPFAFSHLLVLWWARLLKIPIVSTNHVMPENAVKTFKHWPMNRVTQYVSHLTWRNIMLCMRVADFVTAPTPTALKMLQDHGLQKPSKAISNGIDAHYYRPGSVNKTTLEQLGLHYEPGTTLLYVGRLDEEKHLEILVAAMPAIVQKLPTAHLVLVGSGVCANPLRQQAVRLGVNEHVTLTGRVSDKVKRDLLRCADIFVTPSPAELQCIAGLEALACGLPIIAANVAALKELCQDGKNGFLFSYPDAQDFANKAVCLLSDESLRHQFGKQSREWIIEHHELDAVIHQYAKVYHEAIRLRRAALLPQDGDV
ncbi:MAG TPA: glycosyltransferase [Candidatus Acidoferrum sp.]|nr:glycosyltransferase [Candidatus Acidoferrum sp.]